MLGITISVTALAMGGVAVVSGALSSLHYVAPIALGVLAMAGSGLALLTLKDPEPQLTGETP